jgi:hypothetical protein
MCTAAFIMGRIERGFDFLGRQFPFQSNLSRGRRACGSAGPAGHFDRSDGHERAHLVVRVWLMLMRKTSAPASNNRAGFLRTGDDHARRDDSVSSTVQERCLPVSTSKKPVLSYPREAVLDSANGELCVARAHERLTGPFAAAVVVDRVHLVEPRDQLTRALCRAKADATARSYNRSATRIDGTSRRAGEQCRRFERYRVYQP